MELFDIGLDGEEIEASPDFDNLPAEPPKNKICRRKSITKKERDYSIRKIQGLSLDELASFCLDKVLTLSSIRVTLLRVVMGSKHRYSLRDICWPCASC